MILRIIYATLATFCFGFLVNIRRNKLIFAALSGFISIFVFEICMALGLSSYAATFIAAISFSIYAEVMARVLKSTVSTFSLSGLLPIAPGGTLYLAMDAFVKNNWSLGQEYAVATIINAMLLALGVLMVGSFINLLLPRKKAVKSNSSTNK